jgi:hypothetical protein
VRTAYQNLRPEHLENAKRLSKKDRLGIITGSHKIFSQELLMNIPKELSHKHQSNPKQRIFNILMHGPLEDDFSRIFTRSSHGDLQDRARITRMPTGTSQRECKRP